jgi:hypothetical protein
MKNIFSIALLSSLVLSNLMATNDNEIDLTGEVLSGAVVGFEAVDAQPLFSGDSGIVRFKDPGQIDIGTVGAGSDFTENLSHDIFVHTNDTNGVTIEITDATGNNGVLRGFDSADNFVGTIFTSYKLLGSTYTPSSTGVKDLVTNKNLGSATIGKFEIVPDTVPDFQSAGDYGTLLAIAISVK